MDVNPPDHCFRQAARCACCGAFVKGVDSIRTKVQDRHSTWPLTKVPQRVYLWLGGEMVLKASPKTVAVKNKV